MVESLTIREATPEDAGAISALINSLSPFFLADPEDPGPAEGFFRTISAEAIATALAGGHFHYHLALVGPEIAGVVGVRDASHLYHLFVARSFHRRGIALELWRCARAAARARGNAGRFTVNSSVFAVPLYERLGFVATGPRTVKDGIAFVPMELVEPPQPAPPPG